MPLLLLGLIAVGATALLIYYSLGPGARNSRSGESGRRPAIREKHYEKSDDGKVVYLYNKETGTTGSGKKTETDGRHAGKARDHADASGFAADDRGKRDENGAGKDDDAD
ncbi:MAG: hypothetical protein LBO81_01980 [Clostridiales Family XIII bacterium]|nr:hypothetical protein [Clostridiales Family XIII bacterium]